MNGEEGVTVDVILPMEKAGDDRARRAAVAEKLGISPSLFIVPRSSQSINAFMELSLIHISGGKLEGLDMGGKQ